MTVNNNEWLRDQRKRQAATPSPRKPDSWLEHLLGRAGSMGAVVAGMTLVFSGDWRIAIALGIGTAIGFAIKENA